MWGYPSWWLNDSKFTWGSSVVLLERQQAVSHSVKWMHTFQHCFSVVYYLCIVLAEGEEIISWCNSYESTLELQWCLSCEPTHFGNETGGSSLGYVRSVWYVHQIRISFNLDNLLQGLYGGCHCYLADNCLTTYQLYVLSWFIYTLVPTYWSTSLQRYIRLSTALD